MSMHEVRFEWPHPEPKSVIVTGTFDKWSSTRQLTKTPTGFVGSAKIPWNEKILYKYIVDGDWALVYGRPVEVERRTGFVNHVYIAPAKPEVVLPAEPVIADKAGGPVAVTVEVSENVDKNFETPTSSSSSTGAGVASASPVTEEPANEAAGSSAAPIAALQEPVHVDVGEPSSADAKSDSGTTAVADPELTPDIIHAALGVPSNNEPAAKKKPASLPTTPTKGEVFPAVSPPSSPSRFSSLRGSGKKKRTPSFFAKLKEVFKPEKEKDHSKKEKAEPKN